MKKCFAILLSIGMILSVLPVALAAPTRDFSMETTLAGGLKELGLFLGRGQQVDGSNNFDLKGTPNRVEALVMLLRALGKGAEAERHAKSHPFTDVPAWADGYVSYAYEKGLVKGVTAKRFESKKAATADVYLTFMLRALGYTEGTYEDFTWNSPYALAAWCGILPIQVDRSQFLRADLVNVTCAALFANRKGTQTKLYEALISEGLFTKDAFQKAFPTDPFARFHQIEKKVTEALAKQFPLGPLSDKVILSQFGFECHVITNMVESKDVLNLTVWVYYGCATVNQDNEFVGCSGTIAPWQIELDANTLETRACSAPGTRFTESEVREQGVLREGMWKLCGMQAKSQLEQGMIGHQKPNYDEAMAKVKASMNNVQTLEGNSYTAVIGKQKDGENFGLYLVFKPKSKQGEGTISLEIFQPWELFDFHVSEDGMQVQCSYRYKDGNPGLGWPGPQHFSETGTVVTTVDLAEGCTTQQIQEN